MANTPHKPASGLKALLRDERFWQIALQVILVIVVATVFSYLFGNLNRNMSRNGIQFGFGFFKNPASFAIGENLLEYRSQDSYTKVIQAGIVNSLRLVAASIITATIVGVAAGVASFSDNWLVHKISRVYVGLVRNVPLLLQLFFWYFAVYLAAPRKENQIVLPGPNNPWLVASNNNLNITGPGLPDEVWVGMMLVALSLLLFGLMLKAVNAFREGRFAAGVAGWVSRVGYVILIALVLVVNYYLLLSNSAEDRLFFKGGLIALFTNPAGLWILALVALGAIALMLWNLRTKAMLERGEDGKVFLFGLIATGIAAALIVLFAFNWTVPTLVEGGGANGGLEMSMRYAAALTGLTFYTGAFIAEIVRAGIQSVARGQWEAARSVGLSNGKAMRLVVFPQSLRVIIPPLNSEFANLAKNSSLAFAVGYPDLYSVANTTFNQTGRPIEVFLVMMATYLSLNLLISLNMNQLNNAVQFKER